MPEWIIDVLKQAAGMLLAVSPLLNSNIRDFVAKKIQLSFDRAIEDRKGLNARIIDISRIQFEKEFEVYREVSKAVSYLVYNCKFLAEQILTRESQNELMQNETLKIFVSTDKIVGENAPFIRLELATKYRNLLEKCDQLLKISREPISSETQYHEVEELRKKIVELNEDIENSLRTHLDSLKEIHRY